MIDDPERTTFGAWLQQHAGGRTDDELAAGLQELLDMCILHNKTGSMTVTLKVEPKGDGAVISADIGVKTPKVAAAGTFYFRGDDGMPSRRDPNQPELPIGEPASSKETNQ